MSRHLSVGAAGALVLALAAASGARAGNLLTNGSFETGDFTGWTVVDPNDYTSVISGPAPGGAVIGAEDGGDYVASGPVFADGTLSQTFADTPGVIYTVSGWEASDGTLPSDFSISLDGTVFASATPVPASGWREFSYEFVGTGSDTLTIASRNDLLYQYFDNFSISAPEPATWGMMIVGFALAGAGLRRRRMTLRAA